MLLFCRATLGDRTWRKAPADGFEGADAGAKLADDRRYQLVDVVKALDLDELWHLDRRRPAERQQVGPDKVDDLRGGDDQLAALLLIFTQDRRGDSP
jgi:hypothetical protein